MFRRGSGTDLAGQDWLSNAESAAAVLRGEWKVAPQREGKGERRLSYWVAGLE